jgi:hypothetical protein
MRLVSAFKTKTPDPVSNLAFNAKLGRYSTVEHKLHGMILRLIDTPGLQPSSRDIQYNSKVMAQTKRFTRRHKPDIVLYFDRMARTNG